MPHLHTEGGIMKWEPVSVDLSVCVSVQSVCRVPLAAGIGRSRICGRQRIPITQGESKNVFH